MLIHIGIDLDNTIIDYDEVFYKYAAKNNLVPSGTEKSKEAIKGYLRSQPNGEKLWINLQILVYGEGVREATFKEGAIEFLRRCKRENIRVSIISHKTEFDNLGVGIPLRRFALEWMNKRKLFSSSLGLSYEDIFFCQAKTSKIQMIRNRNCTHFIDDLIDIFLDPFFPEETEKLYYSPNDFPPRDGITHFKSWEEIYGYFFD